MRLTAFEDAVIDDATERARVAETTAASTARDIVDRARRDADARVEEARAQGEADADREMALTVLEARRRARRLTLEAQRAAYERLRSAAAAAVAALRDEPGYALLVEALAAAARQRLGEGAQVRSVPEGGVVAEADGRRVDYSLPLLADRALASVAAGLLEAWT